MHTNILHGHAHVHRGHAGVQTRPDTDTRGAHGRGRTSTRPPRQLQTPSNGDTYPGAHTDTHPASSFSSPAPSPSHPVPSPFPAISSARAPGARPPHLDAGSGLGMELRLRLRLQQRQADAGARLGRAGVGSGLMGDRAVARRSAWSAAGGREP